MPHFGVVVDGGRRRRRKSNKKSTNLRGARVVWVEYTYMNSLQAMGQSDLKYSKLLIMAMGQFEIGGK